MRLNLQKSENECKTRDNQIHTLQDEIARQDETIAKATRERKRLEEERIEREMERKIQREREMIKLKIEQELEQRAEEEKKWQFKPEMHTGQLFCFSSKENFFY